MNNHTKLSEYRALRNSVAFFAGSVGTRFLTLITFAILTRYLGETDFGIFTTAITYLTLFTYLLDGGTENILIRDIARSEELVRDRLGAVLMAKLGLAALAVVLAAALLPLLPLEPEGHAITVIMLLLFLLSPKLPTIRTVFESLYRARLQIWFPFVAETVSAVTFLGGLALLIWMETGLYSIAWLYALSGLPGLAILIVSTARAASPRIRWNTGIIRLLLRQSWPLAVSGLLMTLTARINVMILSGLRPMAEVGHYGAAYRLTEPLSFIPVAIVISLFPLMSVYFERDAGQLRHYFNAGLKFTFFIGVMAASLLVILSHDLITLVYGESFAPAGATLRMLSLSIPFWFVNVVFLHLAVAIGQQRRSLVVFSTMLAVTILLNLITIPRWGAAGAAAATLLTEFAAAIIWIFLCRPWIRSDTGMFVAKLLGINLVIMASGLWLIPDSAVWQAAVYCFFFPVFFILLRIHRDRDMGTFMEAVRRQSRQTIIERGLVE